MIEDFGLIAQNNNYLNPFIGSPKNNNKHLKLLFDLPKTIRFLTYLVCLFIYKPVFA